MTSPAQPTEAVASFVITTPTMTVSKAVVDPVEQPKRRGRPSAKAIETPVTNDEITEVSVVVKPTYGRNLFCHTQQKMIYAGFETQLIRDAWVVNQIKWGILTVIKTV